MSEGPRRRVTYTQLETLWEFLNEHRDIATGYNKTARARDNCKRMWQTIAQTLNAQGDGAIKDWKGWNKYWNDYKSKLKKTVAATRASQQRTGGGSSDIRTLTELEQKFLQLLGESFGSGLPGVRVEPFEEVPGIEIGAVENPHNVEGNEILLPNMPLPIPVQPTQASQEEITRSVSVPSSPQPQTSGINERRSWRQRSPLRRVRRREPPQSQEATRRTLVAISEQRNRNEIARNGLLRELIQEIREVKEILRTRLPLPDTPVLDLQDQHEQQS